MKVLADERDFPGPARFYLEQEEVWKTASENDWDGVVVLDSK